MAENKTQATSADVPAFLDSVPDPKRRADAKAVAAMMARVSGEAPVLWGPNILGFGRYHYRYESGREGEMARIGFSPRAKELVLYLMGGFDRHAALMDRLGRYRTGKSCLYIKRLEDVDAEALEALCAASLDFMRQAYPD